MRAFLRDTWVYILIPYALLAAVILAFLLFLGDAPSPFVYTIY